MSNGILALLASGVWGLMIIAGTAVIRSMPGRWPWSKSPEIAPGNQAIPFNVEIGFGTDSEGHIAIALHFQAGSASEHKQVLIPREASLFIACKVIEAQGKDGTLAAERLLKGPCAQETPNVGDMERPRRSWRRS